MKDKFKYIFWGIVVLGAFLLGTQTCKNSSKNDFKTVTDTLIVNKTDTIRDTITVFKMKDRPILTYTSISNPDSTKKLKYYNLAYRDSNMVVYIKDTIDGLLIGRTITYKLIKPIKITDSVKVYVTSIKYDTVIIIPKFQLRAGILANKNGMYGTIDVNIKKITYSIGYDPFNKQGLIGLKYTIFSK